MTFSDIKLMNKSKINLLKTTGNITTRNEIIAKILENENCFFEMSKEDAYMILEDIGISKNKIPEIYEILISK